ncbi:DUF1801 domain-containing protein [Enterococcus sp. BWM-S5]|uniref:DUF1801 domain-containing protein n=1 Tax=Enterococcus larvae TaxID=2794352 RepID=A0ABS4CHN0_9ENTE|nr:DUF1801 domain-containing protein [Enterococcus larvae]MBP1046128.1 DUF1801 domain-containing protein [Enterococcus larvae]
METVKEFFDKIEDPQQHRKMTEVFEKVHAAFPDLEVKIAWNQPMFTTHGTFIIAFSTAKKHMSVAPEKAAIEHFSEEITKAGYKMTKELIQIPWDMPVDFELLQRIIMFNIQEKADYTSFWRK